MVQAWLIDDSEEDQRLEHKRNPSVPVSLEELRTKTGVLYCKLNPDKDTERLNDLRKKKRSSHEDILEFSPEKLPNYNDTIKMFYKEHMHTSEEIRYILAGSCYFDMRDENDDWVRIAMEAGDLIVLPPGIYHRFTLDTKNYAKVMRMFVGNSIWKGYFRPADDMEERKKYVQQQTLGFSNWTDLV